MGSALVATPLGVLMKLNVSSNIKSTTTCSATLSSKYSFSNQHLKSAIYFSECIKEIESTYTPTLLDEEKVRGKYFSYVTSSIILFVASLESSINEFYCEAIDKNPHKLKGVDEKNLSLVAEFWPEIERLSVLQKYQKALFLMGVEKIDQGLPIYQNADSLIKLRDILIHYKPEWDSELDTHKKIQTRLEGKFPLSPLYGEKSLWFPHQCLGYGCAKWANEVVISFMQEFCNRSKIPYRYY